MIVKNWIQKIVLLTSASTAAIGISKVSLPQEPTANHDAAHVLTDPWFEKQNRLFEQIGVLEAWKFTTGSQGVVVGVIDNGFDFFHPDLTQQISPGYYAPNGYHTEFYENSAHGTMVSSIIGAKRNNGMGMSGLAPDCRLLTGSQGMIPHTLIKRQEEYFAKNPKATLADWTEHSKSHFGEMIQFGDRWVTYYNRSTAGAIRYLIGQGVRVINCSFGVQPGSNGWDDMEDAFREARDKNVVIVISAGNSDIRQDAYPGDSETVIVAGGCLLNGQRWSEDVNVRDTRVRQGTNYGERLTVVAPIDDLVVCVPHDKRFYTIEEGPMGRMDTPYEGPYKVLRRGGTSSASPIVTSMVALVLSIRPDLDARQIVELVKQGCDDLGEPGRDDYTGFGRINFEKTLRIAKTAK